jgi:MFS transporter, ACS family, D-galactonate transporter
VLLAFLTTGMFFCYAHRGTLSVAAPFLMKDLGLNPAVMGILLSAFFWSYSLAQVPAGWLLDRYGLGRVYAIGFLTWTIAVALTGLTSSVAMLIAMRMLLGLGQGVPFPASARAVSNWFEGKERGGVIGVYLSGNRLGQAAIAAAGPIAIAFYGWRVFFIAAGIAGLVWLAAWLAFMHWWDAPQTTGAARQSQSIRGSWTQLRDRRILGVFLGYFAYDYVWFLFLTWMPGYLMLERQFGPKEMGIYSSVPFAVVAVVIVLAGMLGDLMIRLGWDEVTARKILITAGMLIGCSIVPAAFVEDRMAAVWLLGISICGLGITAPNAWALTQAVSAKELVATASGIQNLGGNLGGVVAPALTGFIAHATGSFEFAFAIAGFVLLLGIACYWILIPKMEPAPSHLTPGRLRHRQFGQTADPIPDALPAKSPTKP